jgi:hypothetical protein
VPHDAVRVWWPEFLIASIVLLATGCQPSAAGDPSSSPSELPSASSRASTSASAQPTESPPAALVVRLTSEIHNPPVLSLTVEIMSDGRVIEGGEELSTRTLTASGLEQIDAAILSSPLLRDSADYPRELAVPPEQVPIGISGTWTFVIGEQPEPVVVTSDFWLDEAEAMYFVSSPERQELHRLAQLLADPSSWVTPDGWVEAGSAPYESTSYLLWVTVWPLPVPDGTISGAEVTWPFERTIEQFGDVIETGVAEGRCGYIDAPQAADLVTILTGLGFDPPASIGANSQSDMNLATETSWVSLYLSSRTVDEFPTCADAAGFLPPH